MSQKSLPATQVQRTRYADRLVTADGSMTGAEVVAAIGEVSSAVSELSPRVTELENKKVLIVDEFDATRGVATVSSEDGAKVYAGYYDIILVKNASSAVSNGYCAFHKSRVPSSGAIIYVYAYFAKYPWDSSSVAMDTATLYAAAAETTQLSVSYATNVYVPTKSYVDERFNSKLTYSYVSDVLSDNMTITQSFYNSFVQEYKSAVVTITDATLGLTSAVVFITGTGNVKYGFIDEHTIVKITAVFSQPNNYKINISLFDITSISGSKLYRHEFKFKIAYDYNGTPVSVDRIATLEFISNSPTPIEALNTVDAYPYITSTGTITFISNNVFVICIRGALFAAGGYESARAQNKQNFINDYFSYLDAFYPGATPSVHTYATDKIDLTTGYIATRTDLVSNVSITNFSDTVTAL